MTIDHNPLTHLSAAEWRKRISTHRQKLSPIVEKYLYWRTHGLKHPVYDFLFSYYSFSTGQLLRWTPGIDVTLEFDPNDRFDWPDHLSISGRRASVDVRLFPERRIKFLLWAITYLQNTRDRPAVFHCFGLHEWAMVYQTNDRQHPQVPLRLPQTDISEFVNSQSLCCTHYDAFRFFSPDAVPRNRYQLERESMIDFDQAGCIHANMDLYKFGYKVAPFLASELLADLFLLAKMAREIDMRASPYDLSQFGMTPIEIETKDGRELYVRAQRELYENAQQCRERLIKSYTSLLTAVTEDVVRVDITPAEHLIN
jgi:hypothetical protein